MSKRRLGCALVVAAVVWTVGGGYLYGRYRW